MHIIKTGEDRIVIAFPRLGFVLKVARLSISKLANLFKDVKRFYFGKTVMTLQGKINHLRYLIEYFYLRGIYANLKEGQTWKRTKNPFLWPTWFSFFGLVNICPYAERVLTEEEYDNSDLLKQISFFSGYRWQISPHTFEMAYNFCVDEFGKVKMLDYGFENSEIFITYCGQNLYENLNPTEANTSLDFLEFKNMAIESRLRMILQVKTWFKESAHNPR
jgi:hypothetical protein